MKTRKREAYWEAGKFDLANDVYWNYVENLCNNTPSSIDMMDIIHNIPAFAGQVNLARIFFFYECYQKVKELSGHIGEVGVYKGASFLLWAKLVALFEPYSMTQCHGFDWFDGMKPGENDDPEQVGKYKADYAFLLNLIQWQGLGGIAHLHNMDVTSGLEKWVDDNRYLRFKLIFLDCGIEKVLATSLRSLWPRLVPGGILIMDHYNISVSPMESELLEKYTEGRKIYQMPFTRQASGYVIK